MSSTLESFINKLFFLDIMVKRVGSKIRKSRHKLKKSISEKSRIRIRSFLQSFNKGERVALKADSTYSKGQYFLRFYGKTGKVAGKQGDCYLVNIKDLNKKKTVIVHPVHLKKVD